MANLTRKKNDGDESSDKENRDTNAGHGGGRSKTGRRRQAPGRTAEAGSACGGGERSGGGGRSGIGRFEFVRYLVEHEDRITFQVI